jgi:dihydrophenazinedicarboxylate synthase
VTILPSTAPPEFIERPAEPAVLLRRWLADAQAAGEADPFTAVLATADASGQPSTRCLAVRSCEERGLVMFTNLNTRKGHALRANPRAAVTFYWPAVFRQVNITGHVEPTGDDESDALWNARGLLGQVASTVSRQGAKLDDYQLLAARAAGLTAAGPPVARPEGQAGIVLVPQTAEFWHGQASLLHYRLHYARAGTGWESCLLQP